MGLFKDLGFKNRNGEVEIPECPEPEIEDDEDEGQDHEEDSGCGKKKKAENRAKEKGQRRNKRTLTPLLIRPPAGTDKGHTPPCS